MTKATFSGSLLNSPATTYARVIIYNTLKALSQEFFFWSCVWESRIQKLKRLFSCVAHLGIRSHFYGSLPDFKFWKAEAAQALCGTHDYPEVAKKAVKEMYRQVGRSGIG